MLDVRTRLDAPLHSRGLVSAYRYIKAAYSLFVSVFLTVLTFHSIRRLSSTRMVPSRSFGFGVAPFVIVLVQ